jgi:hypothetical protein
MLRHVVDYQAESDRILDERGNVAEHDPFLGVIGNSTNPGFDGHFDVSWNW